MFQNDGKSDGRLVLAVQNGKREDFGVLVRRYLPAVHAIAYARLGNSVDADDVAQESFVRAFQRLDTLRDRGKFGPWLMSIARNASVQVLRSRAREAEIVAELPPPPTSVSPDVEQRELRESLHRAIMQLDAEQRELLLLRYFSGLSIREVALLLGITPNAAKKRVQRARETLGRQMLDRIEALETSKNTDAQVKRIMGVVMALPLPAKTVAAGALSSTLAKVLAGCIAIAAIGGGAAYVGMSPQDGNGAPVSAEPVDVEGSETPDRERSTARSETSSAEAPDETEAATVAGDTAAAAFGTIAGRVYDARTSEAIEELELTLDRIGPGNRDEKSRRVVVTTDGGAYEVPGLPPGTYRFGNPRRYGQQFGALDETVQVRVNQTTTYDLMVNAGISITGVVKDEHGAPLAGVNVSGMTNQENKWHNTSTDAAGRFRVAGFGSGGTGFQLNAAKAGYAMPVLNDLTVPQGGLDGIELVMFEEASVSGTVVNPKGEPLEGIGIASWPLVGGDGPQGQTETAADGTFTIERLFPGEHRIVLSNPGGSSWSVRNEVERVALESGEQLTGLVIVRVPDGTFQIAGRVVDSEGEPVLAANLTIYFPVFRSAHSDAEGNFTFEELPEGSYTIQTEVYHQGRSRSQRTEGVVAGTTDLTIEMASPAQLAGMVVDALSGEPITQFDLTSDAGKHETISGHQMWQYKPHTDPDGAFALEGLEPGDVTVFVRAKGYAQAIHPVEGLAAGESRDGIRIALSKGVTVEGRVLNTSRQPVSGALVYIGSIPEQQMRTHMAMDETDSEGLFKLHVARGETQTVSAYHTDYAPAETTLPVSGAPFVQTEIVLPEGTRVYGKFYRGADAMAGHAVVLLVDGVHMGSVTTDDEGTFQFNHVPAGDGEVTVYVPGTNDEHRQIGRTFDVTGIGSVNVDLSIEEGLGILTGQVTRQGQPTPGLLAELIAVQSSGATLSWSVNLEGDGTYYFDEVPPGNVVLRLVRYEQGPVVDFERELEIADGQTLEVDIALGE